MIIGRREDKRGRGVASSTHDRVNPVILAGNFSLSLSLSSGMVGWLCSRRGEASARLEFAAKNADGAT